MSDAVFGGNKSAEEPGDDDNEASSESGCNIVIANKLVSIPPPESKKAYQLYLKNNYLKRLKERLKSENAARLATFEQNIMSALKKEVFDNFKKKKFDFYIGKDTDVEVGMQALLTYREEDDMPYMLFFKDGLIEEKVVRLIAKLKYGWLLGKG